MSRPVVRERLSLADGHYRSCQLCEHRCAIDRAAGERGKCKAGANARVFRHRVECGEELELIPSHLFYLSGCDLRCAFCIAEANAFDPGRGRELTPEFFSEAVAWGRAQKPATLQWVGGEPTIHLPAIFAAMAMCEDLPPIVWKSDFYGTPEAFELLNGAVDVYVADFKFGNDACAQRIASVPDYIRIVTRNLKVAALQGDLIVRHLLLPGHWECCFIPVLRWLRAELPDVKLSVRDGYLPAWQARRHTELAGRPEPGIGARARSLANEWGLKVVG